MGLDIAEERERAATEAEKKARKEEYKKFVDEEVAKANRENAINSQWICTQCGTVGKPRGYVKGSFFLELFLWVFGLAFMWFFLISLLAPIIYSCWRLASRHKACMSCRGNMIRCNTPMGKSLLERVGSA